MKESTSVQIIARRCFGVLLYGFVACSTVVAHAAKWFPIGPYGGDARAIAVDPADSHHLYLGTEIGWLYDSHDGGATWTRVSQVAKQNDLVLDHILIDVKDPKRLIVGAWRVGESDGGVYISEDDGKTWVAPAEMKRQSVRAMARSATNPNMIVAGTLEGVFQSDDNGDHWKLISPSGSKEIHEIESLAIDPADPKIIYAGTWHLPWKTVDGGANWSNVKQGIIDDSDVFSIIIDPQDSKTLYLSACSGIYKSSDGAEQFHKIQGIPSTARRTRKLLQDPVDPNTVYAGTTEGLYKTTNGGQTFSRMTGPEVIVNDVYVDPKAPNRVLLATDRGGVLSSEDGAKTFASSNSGFSARQLSAFATADHDSSKVFVGVVNDKQEGGVYTSSDGGLKWQQQSAGLQGLDVFSLTQTATGTLLAGTAHGVYRLQAEVWEPSNDLFVEPPPKPEPKEKGKAGPAHRAAPRNGGRAAKPHKIPASFAYPSHVLLHNALIVRRSDRRSMLSAVAFSLQSSAKPAPNRPNHAAERKAAKTKPKPESLDAVVFALQTKDNTIYAGTDHGLLRSVADGHSWEKVPGLELPDVRFFASEGKNMFAAGLRQAFVTGDDGTTWTSISLPSGITQVSAVAVDATGTLWLGGLEGVMYSADHGASWQSLRHLFLRSVTGIYSDKSTNLVYVTSSSSPFAFMVHVPDNKVTYIDTGWPLRFVRPVNDHLLAATLFDGMVVEPAMKDTPVVTAEK